MFCFIFHLPPPPPSPHYGETTCVPKRQKPAKTTSGTLRHERSSLTDISINPGGLNKRTSLHPRADQLRLDKKIRSIYSRALQREGFSVCCHVCFLQLKRAKLERKKNGFLYLTKEWKGQVWHFTQAEIHVTLKCVFV